ncbi:hypothetical protein RHMOL_Rhmol02G0231200 [Rhododendron molle]|uniref:Uncharacterized protein n=1 Tax=Rhododendron molle TaxID=49168 RepID=A0ACC0PSV9_RHOML|nr:hypothetical protein RHMOL_Rhmol02G0231200 [Rhododendron molle]
MNGSGSVLHLLYHERDQLVVLHPCRPTSSLIAIDFAGANLQDVVFEVLSEINSPVGFQFTKESLPAVASFS